MAVPVATALIGGQHSASYPLSDLAPTKTITLSGSATNAPILEWEWSVVPTDVNVKGGYPQGSAIATGTKGDFTDGKSSIQNPQAILDTVGGYNFALRARNAEGWSKPTYKGDGTSCQAIVYILTQSGAKLPPENEFRYSQDLNETLNQATSFKLDELAEPTDVTRLNADTSKHGLLPRLGGGTTNFFRADGNWAVPRGILGSTDIPIAVSANTSSLIDIIVGTFNFAPGDYSSTTMKFVATAYVTSEVLSGVISLYNFTDAITVATLTFTSVSPTQQISGALSFSGSKVYEVRARVVDGAGLGSSDLVVCGWAGLQVRV
jgi:hypothetical protein